jgi:hypothetical protein
VSKDRPMNVYFCLSISLWSHYVPASGRVSLAASALVLPSSILVQYLHSTH